MTDKVTMVSDQITKGQLAHVEELLKDFDVEEVEAAPAVELIDDEELDEELSAAVESDEIEDLTLDAEMEATLAIEDAKGDAYGEVAADEVAPAAAAPTEKKAKAERKAREPRVAKAKAAPIVRDLSAIDPSFFQLSLGDTTTDAAYRTSVIARRPTQKKIAEKFDNVFISVAAGREPSVYVMDLFKILDADKTIDSKTLVAKMEKIGKRIGITGVTYNVSTARSQVGQIMELFPALGIATRTGQTLSMNGDSVIAERLRKLAGA